MMERCRDMLSSFVLPAIAVFVAAADGSRVAGMKTQSLERCTWLVASVCLCRVVAAALTELDNDDDTSGRSTTTKSSTESSSSPPLLFTIPILPQSAVKTRRWRQRLRRWRRYLARSKTRATTATNSTHNSDDHVATAAGRRGRRQTATTTTSQLFEGYGTHYVDLWCGTPTPQRQTLIVDTGSAMTAFPCRFNDQVGCTLPKNRNCGADGVHHAGTLYDTEKSATFATVDCPDCLKPSSSSCPAKTRRRDSGRDGTDRRPCLVEQWYREGSGWEAREARDLCYLGSFHNARKPAAPFEVTRSTARRGDGSSSVDGLDPAWASWFAFPLQFACQTKVSGAFRTQLADGIMGMQPDVPSSLWKQVLAQSESRRRRGGGSSSSSSISQRWQAGDSHHQTQPNSQPSLWMERGVFSLCFSSSPDIHDERLARKGLSAGLLTLGGADPRISTETDMVYTRSGAPPGEKYFGVEIRHMYLAAVAVPNSKDADAPRRTSNVLRLDVSEYDLNRYQVIVDSGSTNTYLTSKAREPFERAWKQLVGSHFDLNERFDSIDTLPTIVFQLKGDWGLNRPILTQQRRTDSLSLLVGATNHPLGSTFIDPDHPHDVIIALPPNQYCEWDVRRRSCRLSFEFDSHEESALGASTLLNYHVLFDAEENRLGWARSSCNYTEIVGGVFPIDHKATHGKLRGNLSNVVASDLSLGEAKSVRYDHEESQRSRTEEDNATHSAINETSEGLASTMASSNGTDAAFVTENQGTRTHASDSIPLNTAIVRSWWVVSGLVLVLLFTMWRIRRRRINGGGGGGSNGGGLGHEDRAPLLRK